MLSLELSTALKGTFRIRALPQWIDFLERHPSQDGPPTTVTLTSTRLKQMTEMNVEVNDEGYQKDMWHDEWDLKTPGDCEDLVLVKRQRLVERHGWPIGALRPLVCRTASGEGHMVLCACTDLGDYFLDIVYPWFGPWKTFDYKLLARHKEDKTWELIGG